LFFSGISGVKLPNTFGNWGIVSMFWEKLEWKVFPLLFFSGNYKAKFRKIFRKSEKNLFNKTEGGPGYVILSAITK
jgi:hypothetical protein